LIVSDTQSAKHCSERPERTQSKTRRSAGIDRAVGGYRDHMGFAVASFCDAACKIPCRRTIAARAHVVLAICSSPTNRRPCPWTRKITPEVDGANIRHAIVVAVAAEAHEVDGEPEYQHRQRARALVCSNGSKLVCAKFVSILIRKKLNVSLHRLAIPPTWRTQQRLAIAAKMTMMPIILVRPTAADCAPSLLARI
jgi:hypothetical protein